jgi:hypothetical protein
VSTVAYCRWHWATLEPEQGRVRWEIIDLALEQARQHGQRLMIRLMPYDPKHPLPDWYRKSGARRANNDSSKDGKIWQPDFSDPLYFKYWSAVAIEAGKRYDGHPDLDSVDISTVGYWGEGWSDYMPEFAVQRKLIDVYLKAFRKTPLLMNFDEPEALEYGTSHGAGWRFDCLGDLRKPWAHMLDFFPIARVQADQMCIRRTEIEAILVHRNTAVADMVALRRTTVVPDHMAGARVKGPHIVRCCEIQGAIYFKRRGLQHVGMRLKGPCHTEGGDIGFVDLFQSAIPSAGIVAVICGPGIGRWF